MFDTLKQHQRTSTPDYITKAKTTSCSKNARGADCTGRTAAATAESRDLVCINVKSRRRGATAPSKTIAERLSIFVWWLAASKQVSCRRAGVVMGMTRDKVV